MICDIIPLSDLISWHLFALISCYWFNFDNLIWLVVDVWGAKIGGLKDVDEKTKQVHQKKKKNDVSYLYACESDGMTYLLTRRFKTWNIFVLIVPM